ncbi:Phosphorylase b kinase regulatory subunit alpha, liver isoform [Thelohanellus kitauei]|uniref:Phosphorylase b kinase regulatory subunit n=1 Tax=Thelohanellus kitauei TaxID=669202 RepID=A0A0C2MQT5_THEKT|nr:Phosphorylase b kinase regulatory subunit alpha, liver isoform [Thelohanellus kitauei]
MTLNTSFLAKIEKYYFECKKFFIDIQNPVTGLLPSSLFNGTSKPENSANFAWIRDNVYSILCVWSLSIGYRKISDLYDVTHRCKELELATVKLMRSLLFCMMKQSEKVEMFKKTLDKSFALHAKYKIDNCGLAGGDADWGHLQIDAISLYLLALAQIISSGMEVIWSTEEVCFIQNLVYYIENAYCTPDYGIFERGDKTNHGLPELNASSIGMAKVLLESILPKESLSKVSLYFFQEVGASLLSILSFPAFAVENQDLLQLTRESIVTKLEGRYGLRRFLRDGHKTADPKRLHYEVNELKIFENIECEWPVFFAYLIVDGMFREDFEQAKDYMAKLKKVTVAIDGFEAVPELYYVPLEKVQAEYKNPKSQNRKYSLRLPHLWSQSLYIVSRLLYEVEF